MKLRFLYRAFKARYRDQRAEIRALLEGLEPDEVAVDVGANKGSYLFWLSRAVPMGKVVAFEPQPRLADYLRRVCTATGIQNVKVEAAGVSDRTGQRTLHIPGDLDSPGASFEHAIEFLEVCRNVQVPIVSLDEYFKDRVPRVGAMKVDVEGHELAVFQGADRLLAEHAPLLVFECESRHLAGRSVEDVLDYLRKRRYDGFFVQRSRLVPLSQFRPELHQRTEGDRFWDKKDYCNNFILRRSA